MNSSPSLKLRDRFIPIRPFQATQAVLTYEDAPRQNDSLDKKKALSIRRNATNETHRKRTRSAIPLDRTPARKRQRQFSDSLASALFDDAQQQLSGYEAASSDLSDDAVFSSSPRSISASSTSTSKKTLMFTSNAIENAKQLRRNAFEETFYRNYSRFPLTQQQRHTYSASPEDSIQYMKRARKPLLYSSLALHALDARGLTSDYTANSLSWTPLDAPTQLLATFLSGSQGVFHTWNPARLEVKSIQPNCRLSASSGKITALAWRSGGRQIATGSEGAVVSIYDIEAQACQTHLRPTPLDTTTSMSVSSIAAVSYSTTSLSWSSTSTSKSNSSPYILANSYSNGHLLISDIRRMNESTCLSGPTGRSISHIEWDPLSNGVYLASGHSDGRAKIWDSRKFTTPMYESPRIELGSSRVIDLAWSNTDRGVLAIAGGTPEISFLRFNNLSQHTKFASVKTSSNVNRVLWTYDSSTLVTCQSTSSDSSTSQISPQAIADGQTSASRKPQLPNPIMLYSFPSMQEIATLEGHVQATRHAVLSSDGTKLVTGGEEETLKVWKMPDVLRDKSRQKARKTSAMVGLVDESFVFANSERCAWNTCK